MNKYFLTATLVLLVAVASAQNLFHEGLFYEPVVTGLVIPTAFDFVGNDTILVNQKASGEVLVVRDGGIAGVALDLTVANANEMGMLGIVRHPDYETNRLVYFYSYATTVISVSGPTPVVIWFVGTPIGVSMAMVCANPSSAGANPSPICANPSPAGANPPLICANPSSAGTNPSLICANPSPAGANEPAKMGLR